MLLSTIVRAIQIVSFRRHRFHFNGVNVVDVILNVNLEPDLNLAVNG